MIPLAQGWLRSRGPLSVNLSLMAVAMTLFSLVDAAGQRIAVNGGLGWVGVDYAAMLENGWTSGGSNPALRPLIVWLNGPAYHAFAGDVITAFTVMNYVYVGILAFAVCVLFDRYSRDAAAKLLMIVNLFLCIATVRYVAFYPVGIDSGAYAILTLTVFAIVAEKRVLACVGCAAAVLSREFGIAAVLFGIHRDVRRGVSWLRIVATYAPALLIGLGWRAIVARELAPESDGEQLVNATRLLRSLEYWSDPVFVVFFAYFLVTVFGGVSLVAVARAPDVWRLCRKEHEWLTFALFVVGVSAMGDVDLWRYLAFLIPLFVVAFAVSARALDLPGRRWLLTALVCVATVLTQRPFEQTNLVTYFRDWFPYYVRMRSNVPLDPLPPLWDVWLWKLVVVAVLVIAVAWPNRSQGGSVPVAGPV